VMSGDSDLVQLLINAGANPTQKDGRQR